jgi:hypothetical protein
MKEVKVLRELYSQEVSNFPLYGEIEKNVVLIVNDYFGLILLHFMASAK